MNALEDMSVGRLLREYMSSWLETINDESSIMYVDKYCLCTNDKPFILIFFIILKGTNDTKKKIIRVYFPFSIYIFLKIYLLGCTKKMRD